MTHVRNIRAFKWLAFAAAGLYLLAVAAAVGAPQEGSIARPPKSSKRAHSPKPTWHSGPASTPPETEILLPPPADPPPAKSTLPASQAEAKNQAGTKPWATTPVAEPEAKRIELNRLRDDAVARRAFYDELRGTVEQVRSGRRDEDSKNPPSSHPVWRRFHGASGEPPNPPPPTKPNEPANAESPQASLGTHAGEGVSIRECNA
jgi:hypothetical protein